MSRETSISSFAWALGQTVVLGLGADSQTAANLTTRPELVINLPSPGLWDAVERLAPLTGAAPVPAAKQARGYRINPTHCSPLIFNFRHYQGLALELGNCFTSEAPPKDFHR
ncbi:hypothetical protein [Streptomyces sp. NPDC001165]|uniref:hypothetical protein n=1 Tax=Streptomyces sp. NPDC001165 TaxID=3364546 RepID=UPI0036BBAED4